MIREVKMALEGLRHTCDAFHTDPGGCARMTDVKLHHQGHDYSAVSQEILVHRNGVALARFAAAPLVNGKPTVVGGWREAGPQHLCADLQPEGEVHFTRAAS